MSLKASIDIGTNSTRLLLIQINKEGKLSPVEHYERLTKLGAGLDQSNRLSPQAMNRVIKALQEYRDIITKNEISEIRAFATSATRDAKNRNEFLALINERTGFSCRILSGNEEARLSFLGVTSDLHISDFYLVSDVGGGSSEFINARGNEILYSKSFNIGSGRLTRQFFHHDPPPTEEIKKATDFVKSNLHTIDGSPQAVVCVGGTAATLALIDAQVPFDDSKHSHHYRLEKSSLQQLVLDLGCKTLVERKSITGLNPERADVLLAGALIHLEIMNYFSLNSVVVSLRDLMFGIFLE
jgi:exopolyphosphatase / guanosine-5'-triphosphate,3'-diphosphate pyrophosphatase